MASMADTPGTTGESLHIVRGAIGEPETNSHAGMSGRMYKLEAGSGPRPGLSFEVAGLPAHNLTYRWIGVGILVFFTVFFGVALRASPSLSTKAVLEARRDKLFARVKDLDEGSDEYKRILRRLDRIYHQIDILGGSKSK